MMGRQHVFSIWYFCHSGSTFSLSFFRLNKYRVRAVWAGRLAVGVGALIALGHYVLLKRQLSDLSAPDKLITRAGLYRYVRHPMCTGDVIMYAGLTWLAPGVGSLLLLAVGSYAIYEQALVEDRHMAERFGSEFEQWRDRTRLLIPEPSC